MPDRNTGESYVPRATYRLQLTENQGFRFVAQLVPYLAKLGVSHCYLSPYLKTRPHSTHGYDVIDHSRLNPELGDDADYDFLCRTLDDHGLRQLLDIVPNHIGVMGSDNRWWLDVLENGQASRYADYFDIDWRPVKAELANKVLVPVLGDHYGNVLLAGNLVLDFHADAGELSVWYYEHRFPIDPAAYPMVLEPGLAALTERHGDAAELIELQSVIRALKNLPPHTTDNKVQRNVRAHEQLIAKRRLCELAKGSELVGDHIRANVVALNGEPGDKDTYRALHALLERQPYRVAYWRVAADEINYRRFFDINDLAGLRTQNEDVFEATHRQLLTWVTEGRIHGFRIDHPDGLYDPRGYLTWLRGQLDASGFRDLYLIVEKILAPHEYLPEDWPVHGTTGYDFTFAVNGLYIHTPDERELDRTYESFARVHEPFEELLYRAKRQIVTFHLSSELTVLANLLDRLGEQRLETRDFTQSALRDALLELVACFPVYRSYIADGRHSTQDRQYIDWAVNHARRNYPTKGEGVFEFIRSLLLYELPDDVTDAYREEVSTFAGKFQQLTAPAMAKALEDTSFYRHVKLLSLNEVGSEPTRFGLTPSAFHRLSQIRLQHWPHTMLGTSTHDSKRSEDVRARINVLTEIPDIWRAKLTRWRRLNHSRHRIVDGEVVPSRNEEYLFYQTLAGSWPVPFDTGALAGYAERIEAYMIKALREAKVHTSWSGPNEDYEAEVVHFVRETLNSSNRNRFVDDMNEFVDSIARSGYLNGLSQTLLKLTSPGVPDVYQGNELWDFSLVDPDNRRPVDYNLRQQLLSQIEEDCEAPARFPGLLRDMLDHLEDGRAKLYLTWRVLTLRRSHPEVFTAGDYTPLDVSGDGEAHVVAFAREHESDAVAVAAGRWFHVLQHRRQGWGDTTLSLPRAGRWRNVLTDEVHETTAGNAKLRAELLFAAFPVALLHLQSG